MILQQAIEHFTLGNLAIVQAHKEGFSTFQIEHMLKGYDISLSQRQIQRVLLQKGYNGQSNRSSLEHVIAAIEQEKRGPGEGLGYRLMWNRLRSFYGLNVSRRTVQIAMKYLDPNGCIIRRARRLHRRVYTNEGANKILHIDGYDKLKPFGLCIHGAIDGFSRKVVWLKVGPTNNNPRVVAGYYLDFINEVGGIPRSVRTDGGSENTMIHDIHTAFTMHFNAGGIDQPAQNSVIVGRSVNNQRIERYWRDLRAHMQMVINLLKDLCERGVFNRNDDMDKQLVRYCFTRVVQDELDKARDTWNSHHIRPSRNAESPPGVPNVLYTLPELSGGRDYLIQIPEADIHSLEDLVVRPGPVSEDLNEFLNRLRGNQQEPRTIDDCAFLYAQLKDAMNN